MAKKSREALDRASQAVAEAAQNPVAEETVVKTETPTSPAGNNSPTTISLAAANNNADTLTPEQKEAAFREKIFNEYGVETEAQKEKRQRMDAIRIGYSGMLDGLNSLANLYFTTKGAPNMAYKNTLDSVENKLAAESAERAKNLAEARARLEREAQIAREEARWNKEFDFNKGNADRNYALSKDNADRTYELNRKVAEHNIKQDGINNDFRERQFEQGMQQANRQYNLSAAELALKQQQNNSVGTSVKGGDGYIYNRTQPITVQQAKGLVLEYLNREDLEAFRVPTKHTDEYGNVIYDYDYEGALMAACDAGMIPADRLKELGFKKGNYNASNTETTSPWVKNK